MQDDAGATQVAPTLIHATSDLGSPRRDLTLAAIGFEAAPLRRSLSQSALNPRPTSTHRSRLTFLAVNAAEPLRRMPLSLAPTDLPIRGCHRV